MRFEKMFLNIYLCIMVTHTKIVAKSIQKKQQIKEAGKMWRDLDMNKTLVLEVGEKG